MVPPTHRYHQDAPTSCRPSRRRFGCPSRRRYLARPVFAPSSTGTLAGLDVFVATPSPFCVETTGSPGFLGSPLLACRALRPRRASDSPRHVGESGVAFRRLKDVGPGTSCFRGSMTRPTRSLSTLRSQGHPCTTQDSLAARWLSVRCAGLSPAGLLSRVSELHRISFLSSQASPGALRPAC